MDLDLDELRYSPEHIWVRLEDDQQAVIGLSEWAFSEPTTITKVRLISEGEEMVKDEPFGRLTTSKPNLIRLYAPFSGEVLEQNSEMLDAPEVILEDPYEEGWLLRVEITNMAEYDDLMTFEEYEDYLDEGLEDEEDELEGEDLDEDEDEDDE
ncbi:MAG: glycine cleavage system protein H [Thermodesulfobacteriota bacterium]